MESATASAPGRVNLIGEHLDYNGGLCLPIAIGRRTSATVTRAAATSVHSAHAGADAYVRGVLAALKVAEPLRIEISSTVPLGAGLSSSAALTCSVALAVDALLGLDLRREDLLAATIIAENDHVGVPTGGMDQAVSLFGEAERALLLDFDAGTRTAVPWAPEQDGVRLLVVDTGVRHELVQSAYAERRATCEEAATSLGLPWLARASVADLERLSGISACRARHVVTEQQRVRDLVEAAARRDWTSVGRLMTASHLSLREDYEVSCPELDAVVEDALARGALGARMTGGGFGGCAIVLLPEDAEAPTAVAVEASRGASVDAAG